MNKGVADESTKVSIRRVGKTVGVISYRVENVSGESVYMGYELTDAETRRAVYPYWLECRRKNRGPFTPEVEYDFAPSLSALEPGQYFVFDVRNPTAKSQCFLSIGYTNEKAAKKINSGEIFSTETDLESSQNEWKRIRVAFK